MECVLVRLSGGISLASMPLAALMRAWMASLSTPASMIRCTTWMFFGPSSRAMACATARRPNFAAEKAAKPLPPRMLAVAPVKRMVPLPRRLAADQEAGVTGKLPCLEEQLFRGLDQRLVDVGAGVEQADLDRSDLAFNASEDVLDLLFVTRIHTESIGFLTFGLKLVD